MKVDHQKLGQNILEILEDPALIGQHQREVLAQLWELYGDQLARIQRMMKISDAYQSVARQQDENRIQLINKHMGQLEKIIRISDRYQSTIHKLNLDLQQASTHDALTGLGNRRLLISHMEKEEDRSKRYRDRFVLAFIDIDYFKQINDVHGHNAGDQVLTETAECIKESVRGCDICGRWGGEEFLLILPRTDLNAGLAVTERVQQAISKLRVHVESGPIGLTVSIGVAEHQVGEKFLETLARADTFLFVAKRAGRNRMVWQSS